MAFVLASASLQRQNLLKEVFIYPDKVFPCDVDESVLRAEAPKDYVQRVTQLKADYAFAHNTHDIILAADTIVTMGRRIFQRPASLEEAREMLTLFSGRRQQVYTHVIVKNQHRTVERFVMTRISFKRMSEEEIEGYLRTHQWKNASGGLCLEKYAGRFIKAINGSFSNVLGLPLCETCNMLEGFGIKPQV